MQDIIARQVLPLLGITSDDYPLQFSFHRLRFIVEKYSERQLLRSIGMATGAPTHRKNFEYLEFIIAASRDWAASGCVDTTTSTRPLARPSATFRNILAIFHAWVQPPTTHTVRKQSCIWKGIYSITIALSLHHVISDTASRGRLRPICRILEPDVADAMHGK